MAIGFTVYKGSCLIEAALNLIGNRCQVRQLNVRRLGWVVASNKSSLTKRKHNLARRILATEAVLEYALPPD